MGGQLITFVILIGLGYFVGRTVEARHFALIRSREKLNADFPAVTLRSCPFEVEAGEVRLVRGSAVISLDYFKRVLAGLRAVVGGRVKVYEPLLDRGRREAIQRMIFDATEHGYDAVYNVRLETACLASGSQGTGGIEVLAYGTAVKRRPA